MHFRTLLKLTFIFSFIIGIQVAALAQGIYTRLGGGYQFGISSNQSANVTLTRTGNPQSGNLTTVEEAERVKINYGKGLAASAAAGYMFNELVGAELEISYLKGGDNKNTFRSFSQNSSFGYDSAITETNQYARMILLQPSVVLNGHLSDKIALYAKFGIVISKGFIIVTTSQNGANDSYTKVKYKDGWGYGMQAALGVDAKLTSRYAFYAELKMSNLIYSPVNLHVEKFIYNGEDITNSGIRDTPLKDKYTNVNGQQNVQLKTDFPFSFVGLHIGIKRSF